MTPSHLSRAAPRALIMVLLITTAWCTSFRQPEAEAKPGAPSTPAAPSPSGDLPGILLAPAFAKLSFARPVQITHAGDGSGRLFVVEQPGRIRVFPNRADADQAAVFLDIRSKVYVGHNEEGLLSLVFDPEYARTGIFYVYYSAANPRRTIIARFHVSAGDADLADPASERIILEVEQPYGNHKGSTLLFGADGFLYASYGDGGNAADPHGSGQNLSTLLAKIIRIDVSTEENGRAYAIPKDNPFVDRPGARPEIWAYGLRNVWRMSFDRATGELWAGDVGQDAWEEVDLIVKGGNYGWNIREGKHPFPEQRRRVKGPEPTDPLIEPVVDYPRDQGISITGGFVYRGKQMPGLIGAYIYGDYASGRIWALRCDGGKVTAHREIYSDKARYISSFGEDADGELYICAFDHLDGRGGSEGRIYRLHQN
jgi:glucose/arabinose dehydrogenase